MSSHEQSQPDVKKGYLPSLHQIRGVLFSLVVLVALALYGIMMSEFLTFPFTAWFVEPGIHHYHDLVIFGMIWLGILGIAAQVYMPRERVNAVFASVLIMVPIGVLAFLSNSPIVMMPIIFGVLGLLVLILHPAGRTLLKIDLAIPGNHVLGGLLVVAAVPLGWYAINELILQFTVADSHTELVHYGGMAVAAIFILGMGVLATVRDRDRRFAAWTAGILAAYIGVAAIAYPVQTSSPGVVWGVLVIGWAVAFVATTEWSIAQQEAS